ncbi:MAG TPA: SGNH/GDSL hydrolase family protein, partial [Pyrinomonadaceae bacterium]
EPILKSGLAVSAGSPANVLTEYLRARTRSRSDEAGLRSVASLYQTILEVERDGDLLQDQFAFYIALGLPVYVGQLGLPGGDDVMLAAGRELERRACASPYATDAAAWQIAGRKVWNWGEKHLHIRDDKVLAAELLRERDVRAVVPRLRAVPAQKVAVVGHSFTMGQHWSSPSSFVPVVTEIFRRVNPKVEFKQFERGGLTASRARQRFYQGVLDWKPDKVLLVVMTRTEEDYAALKEMGEGFKAAGVEAFMFDDIHDPESVSKPGTSERAARVAREAGIKVIEVGALLAAAPNRGRFVSLDRIHMTEPYHRLMAKEWLKFLAGSRGERLVGRAE